MATIYLICNSFPETTRPADTEDEWDRGDTSSYWSFSSFKLAKPAYYAEQYESCVIDSAPAVGDTVHAVVAIWSTGDSFGHDDRARAEVFFASTDLAAAQNAKDMLRLDKKPDGTPYKKYELPWDGYFENLDEIFIHSDRVVA